MATNVEDQSESNDRLSSRTRGRGGLPSWVGRGKRLEEGLRAVEEACKAADGAAQESRAKRQEAVEALMRTLAKSLAQNMHEEFGRLRAAVEELKQPSPPDEDVQIGHLYRAFLRSGQRGTIHDFITWMKREGHRQGVRLAVQALFEGEETRPKSTMLKPEKRAEYEGLLTQVEAVQDGTDLVA